MAKISRDKGARLEREVCNLFLKNMGWVVERELDQYQGKLGRDIKGSEPFCIQIKGGAAPNIHKAFDESKKAVQGSYIWPIAMTKKDRGEWLITMDQETFFSMLVCIFGTDTENPEDTREEKTDEACDMYDPDDPSDYD